MLHQLCTPLIDEQKLVAIECLRLSPRLSCQGYRLEECSHRKKQSGNITVTMTSTVVGSLLDTVQVMSGNHDIILPIFTVQ